jgi:serine/threonine protein kinase
MNEIGSNARDDSIVRRWCASKGPGWLTGEQLGAGGTAPVFEVTSPQGLRALKIYDASFSSGAKGEIEQKRIEQQLALTGHNCPSLVQIYEGGRFEDRLYLLMSRAPGTELEKRLRDVPRNRIRHIVDQVVRATLFLKSKDLCHRDIKAANIFVSDDFEQVTLLDISVVRNIHDPVGVGTDHDGQLPVVATARYSPPEYLFRLLEPGPKLWHALNIYQLGALLHDLIKKEPLFETEYIKSKDNRYRFAWIVATASRKIDAEDVDQDLVFTARRSLDIDWERRSILRLEDFLADSNARQASALRFLGLASDHIPNTQSEDVSGRHQRALEISRGLEDAIVKYLRGNAVTATHELMPGLTDTSKLLTFRWNSPTPEADATFRRIEFQLTIQLLLRPGGYSFGVSAKLSASISDTERSVSMELPEASDGSGVEATLARQVEAAFAKLAIDITRAEI